MSVKRVVIKIGTNLLTLDENTLNESFLSHIVEQIAEIFKKGFELVVVTSGAIACGRSLIQFPKETKNIPVKQVLAAVGQSILMQEYVRLFRDHNIVVAQILLTELDVSKRENFFNTRNILQRLLSLRIVPIVNENDVVAYKEIKFEDNDTLSARLAAMIDADMLILLTDVEGLYEENPKKNAQAKLIKRVEKITPEIIKMASGTNSKKSLGGMKSKVNAANYAVMSGIDTIIAHGREKNILIDILEKKEKKGTFFVAACSKKEGRKKWMQPQINKNTSIFIDNGACRALHEKGSSLLPKGVKKVKGTFHRGDVIQIMNEKGMEVGYGIVNYDSEDLERILGRHSSEIATILKACFEPEVVHRDNLIVL